MIDPLARALVLDRSPVPADGQRRAAVAAILVDGKVLLMVRAARDGDPWSGHIALPGGRHEIGDVDLLATAIRETREEIGVELAHTRVLGNLPVLMPFMSGPNGMQVTPYVFAPSAPVVVQLGPEAESIFWLPLDLAAAGKLDAMYLYPKANMEFACWRFEGHTIWGLTYRILQDLLARTK